MIQKAQPTIGQRLSVAWRALTWSATAPARRGRALDLMTKKFEYRWPLWKEGQPQWQPVDLLAYMEEGFSANALIYETIQYKARAALSAPLRAYVGTVDSPELAAPEHPLSKLVSRPNPSMDAESFRMMMEVYLNLTGNCYILCDRGSRDGDVEGLYLLRPDRVFIVPGKGGIRGYLYKAEGQALRDASAYLPRDVIHIKLPNPADPLEGMGYGLSPVTPIAKTVDVDNALSAFLKLWIDGAPNFPFAVSYDVPLEPDAPAEIRARYKELHGGFENWTDFLILDQGASIQKIGYSFEELGFVGIDDRNEPRMTGVFGVSPVLLASRIGLTNSAYANIQTYKRTFWTDTMLPELQIQQGPLRYHLATPDGGFVMFDTSGVAELRGDVQTQIEGATKLFTMGVPRKDAFQVVGLRVPRSVGDDVSYLPFNLIPTSTPTTAPSLPPGTPESNPTEKPTEAPPGEGEPTSAPTDERAAENAPGKGKKKVQYHLTPVARGRLEQALYTLELRAIPAVADAAGSVFQDQMEQALVMAAQVKQNARRERKSVNWDDYVGDFEKWLDEHSYEIFAAAFIPALGILLGGAPQALIDQVGWAGVFGSFSLRDIEAEAFWQSYLPPFVAGQNATTITGIKELIAEGLKEGWSNDNIVKQMGLLFEQWMGNGGNRSAWLSARTPVNRREMISRSETIRASNAALQSTYELVGVNAKEWFTAADPCEFCAPLNGTIVEMDQLFFKQGDVYTIGEGDTAQSMKLNYSDVGYPPLHVKCRCVILPVLVDVEIPLSEQANWEAIAA